MFQQQPDQSKNVTPKLSIADELKRDAMKLSDDVDAMRMAEIDRIYDLLMQEPERWDGMS